MVRKGFLRGNLDCGGKLSNPTGKNTKQNASVTVVENLVYRQTVKQKSGQSTGNSA